MRKKWIVRLTDEQRARLRRLVRAGAAPARQLAHARILLKADQAPGGPGWRDAAITQAVEVSRATVERVRRRFAEEGLEAALVHRPPRATKPRKLDGRQEAHLIAHSCSPPPPGHKRWSMRLLAERFVTLECGAPVSDETVRRTLKQTRSSPG